MPDSMYSAKQEVCRQYEKEYEVKKINGKR